MAKYLAVYRKDKEEVQFKFYNQLLDGVAAVNRLFGGSEAEDAATDRHIVNVERVSLVLELHDERTDAFLFRVPQFASQKLTFETDGPLKFVGAKPQQPGKSGIRSTWQAEQQAFVAF